MILLKRKLFFSNLLELRFLGLFKNILLINLFRLIILNFFRDNRKIFLIFDVKFI